ncbi:16S rRNA (guanine(527)-N(7))-methyltransferase RsmG [Selenomonadales bacterium OttesenSCG-928-I06]|nr:16S rRNA (guanine(527)-N(7))-methyltransferase RsmG [Selenomonadales bacterium OttesenSCG-928-I06]
MTDFINILDTKSREYGIKLSQEQLAAFDIYYNLLIEFNQKVNLTALTAPEDVAVKHIIDSLSCFDKDLFLDQTTVLDLGTGAGFPGMPLKIFYPNLKLTLVDSLKKRLNFLEEVISTLQKTNNLGDIAKGMNEITLVHSRAETLGKNKTYRESQDIVVSRAVAKLSVLSEYCLPLVKQNGCFVALKGANLEEELKEAEKAINILGGTVFKTQNIVLPDLPDKRFIVYIKKIKETPSQYPRREGIPEKKSL